MNWIKDQIIQSIEDLLIIVPIGALVMLWPIITYLLETFLK